MLTTIANKNSLTLKLSRRMSTSSENVNTASVAELKNIPAIVTPAGLFKKAWSKFTALFLLSKLSGVGLSIKNVVCCCASAPRKFMQRLFILGAICGLFFGFDSCSIWRSDYSSGQNTSALTLPHEAASQQTNLSLHAASAQSLAPAVPSENSSVRVRPSLRTPVVFLVDIANQQKHASLIRPGSDRLELFPHYSPITFEYSRQTPTAFTTPDVPAARGFGESADSLWRCFFGRPLTARAVILVIVRGIAPVARFFTQAYRDVHHHDAYNRHTGWGSLFEYALNLTHFSTLLEQDSIVTHRCAALFLYMLISLNVYGLTLAGWSTNSKYAFIGALQPIVHRLFNKVALGTVLFMGSLLRALPQVIKSYCGTPRIQSWHRRLFFLERRFRHNTTR